MDTTNKRPINILSIDGGSNGLPALYMLEEMFSRLKYDLKSEEELRPCNYFDVFGGSGTGALVALLLGRLKMTTAQAIEAYMKLTVTLSPATANDEEQQRENSAAFEGAFREILQDTGVHADESLLNETSPKILVFTLNIDSMSIPYAFFSYRTRSYNRPFVTVLQAACASVASPPKFVPVTIGEGDRQITVVDATTGYANPTMEILREAKEAFGGEVEVATILSLGAATKVVRYDSVRTQELPEKEILQQVLENCGRVHQEVHRRLGESAIYHRFTIDIDPELPFKGIFSLVSSHMQQEATTSALDLATRTVNRRPAGPTLSDINSIVPREIVLKPRPSLVRDFVGRGDILRSMHQNHFNGHNSDTLIPSTTVLTGLGGSGKTQIALKFACEYEKRYPDAPVYFVDGNRETTLKTDLETIARSQGPNYRSSSYEDSLIWLAARSKEWLLIIDNVDDPAVRLSSFIPRCSHGHIVITTRDATRKILSPNSTHVVEGLAPSDAVALLLNASGFESSPTNQILAKEIVGELGHLPLALAHAAAYISIHQCLSTFLSTYRQSQTHLLEISPDLVHSYSHSVAATIQISLDQLSPTARDLLRIFAHLDARSIAYTVLAKAAEGNFRHVEKTDEPEQQPKSVEQASVLMNIFCPSQSWVPAIFDEIISTCLRYSLLKVATQNEERFYSMHVLVRDYLQINTNGIQGYTFPQLVARLLGSAITTSDHYYDHLTFYKLLFPHIRLVEVDNVIEAGDHYGFGNVLSETADGAIALTHLELCLEQWKQFKGEDDRNTLAAMTILGNCYAGMGSEEKALEIREKALGISRRVRGNDHLETLVNMQNLAKSYLTVGRDQEALKLREKVLERYKELLGDEHRDTLSAMHNLASSYVAAGHEQDALGLEEKVLEKYRRLLGGEHPDTVTAMLNLAVVYAAVGRDQEALGLDERVLESRKVLLGEEHRGTFLAMHNLADSYSAAGREQEAVVLGEKVSEKYRRLLGDEHPDTLVAMLSLARFYSEVGREQEALGLKERVVESRKVLLGEEHRDTLAATHSLAASYSAAGREQEALGLKEKLLEKYRVLLGDEHPDTLRAMINLACSYSAVGRGQEAIKLEEIVVEKRRELLGDDHRDTLSAIFNLSSSCSDVGRGQEALKWAEIVLEKYKVQLGDDHRDTFGAMLNVAKSYSVLGRNQEALPIQQRVLSKFTKILSEGHADTLEAMRDLAKTYRALGMATELTELLHTALPLHERILGPDHMYTKSLCENESQPQSTQEWWNSNSLRTLFYCFIFYSFIRLFLPTIHVYPPYRTVLP